MGEIAVELKLDPNNQVTRAVASRETWSGIVVSWPVDEINERLPVELSGLPVFDRERSYRGYRGFGVCRDIDRINALARTRHDRSLGFMHRRRMRRRPIRPPWHRLGGCSATADRGSRRPRRRGTRCQTQASPAPAAMVVRFRQPPPADPNAPPTLSPIERRAFRELAQELTSRLHGQAAPAERC